eukprot:g1479.t1
MLSCSPHKVVLFGLSLVVFLWLSSTKVHATPTLTASLVHQFTQYTCSERNVVAVLSLEAKNGSSSASSLSLTAALDASNSMSKENRLPLVQLTSKFVVDQLNQAQGENEFGIITFNKEGTLLADLVRVTNETTGDLYDKIDSITLRNKTNILDGVITGIEQQESDTDGKLIRSVFVMTDGRPAGKNIEKNATTIVSGIREKLKSSERNITLYTFGVGTNLSLGLLRQIAELGNGVSYFIPNEPDIAKAFGDALGGLMSTVATNIRLQISGINGAQIMSVESGYIDEQQSDGSFDITIGNMFLEEARDILIRFTLPSTCESVEYISVTAVYTDAVNFTIESIPVPPKEVNRTDDDSQQMNGGSEIVGLTLLRYEIVQDLDRALEKLIKNNKEQCIQILTKIQSNISESKFNENSYLIGVNGDLDLFIRELTDGNKTKLELTAVLYGIFDAIKKQRSGLTDTRYYLTNATRTTAIRTAVNDAKTVVISSPPESPSPPQTVPTPAPQIQPPESPETVIETSISISSRSPDVPPEVIVDPPEETHKVPVPPPAAPYEPPVEFPELIFDPFEQTHKVPVLPPEVPYEPPVESPEKNRNVTYTEPAVETEPKTSDLVFEYNIVEETIIGDYKELEVVFSIFAPSMLKTQATLSLTTVLDRSGSMDGDPFDLLKRTQKVVLDTLLEQKTSSHLLGMVFFSTKAHSFLELQRINDIDVTEVKRKLDDEKATGSTALQEGLLLGVEQQASQEPTCAGSRVVFLFTDGKPSTSSDIAAHLNQSLYSLSEEIIVYTFGLGSNVNEQLLLDISKVGGGKYYYLNELMAIPRSFGDALGGLLSLAAKNIEVSVSSHDEVEIVKTFPKAESEHEHKFMFPDLYLEERRDILMTLRVPKDADITQLLNFEVSYTDTATCLANKGGSFELDVGQVTLRGYTRVIESVVVQYLVDVETHCETGELTKAIDILTEAVVFVSESADSANQNYIEDLMADLIRFKYKCRLIRAGFGSIQNIIADIRSLRIILITQRSTFFGHSGFHIETHYDTTYRRELRRNFTEDITSDRPRPRLNAVNFQQSSAIEVVSSETTVTVPLEINVIDEPEIKPASVVHISFIIDARINSTVEEISKASEFVMESLQSYVNGSVTMESSAAIIVLTSEVKLLLPMTPFSQIDMQEVQTELDQVVPAGNGLFVKAIEAAYEEFETISKDKNFFLCLIAGSTVLSYDSKTEVETIEQMIRNSVSKVTFIPAAGTSTIIEQYFGAYPTWLKTHSIVIDSWQRAVFELNSIIASIAARHLMLKFDFVKGVTPLAIDGFPFPSDNVTMIADVQYSNTITIQLTLKLNTAATAALQNLFKIHVSYFDVRSFRSWNIPNNPSIVTRVSRKRLQLRYQVRTETRGILVKLEEGLKQGNCNRCHVEVVQFLARISGLDETNDPVIKDIENRLEHIARHIQEGTEQSKDLQLAIDVLQYRLNVKSFFGNTTKETKEEEEEDSTPPSSDYPLKFVFIGDTKVSNVAQNLTVNFTLVVPPSTWDKVAARITLILDTSSTAKLDINLKITEALLNQIAHQGCKRSIQILSWNEDIMSVWETEDLRKEEVKTVMERLNKIEPTGRCLEYSAITQGFHVGHSSLDSSLEIVWLIVSSNSEDDESFQQRIAAAKSDLESELASVTVFTFFSGLEERDANALKEISKISGGDSFDLDSTTDFIHIARKATFWIDTALFKNVKITIKPSQYTKVLSIRVYSESGEQNSESVMITSLHGDQEEPRRIHIGIHVEVGSMIGNQELFRVSGSYFNIRLKQTIMMESRAYLVNRIETGDLKKLEELDHFMENVLASIPAAFSHGNIVFVLRSVKESQKFIEFLRIGGHYLVEHTKSVLHQVRTLLENYLYKGASSSDLESAADLLNGLTVHTTITQTLISSHTVSRMTFSDQAGRIQIPISLKTPTTGVSLSQEEKLLFLTIVLDAGEYGTIIDPAESVLEAQRHVVVALITSLVQNYGYQVNVTFIISYEEEEEEKIYEHLLITDITNIKQLNETFDAVKISGRGIGMFQSLDLGLYHQSEILNSTRRTIIIFSETSVSSELPTGCLVTDEDEIYEEVIKKYSYRPLSPVRVLTFILGKRAHTETNDAISALTGGARFYLARQSDIDSSVQTSVSFISQSVYQSIELTITPVDWLTSNLSFPSWSYVKKTPRSYIVSIPHLRMGVNTEFNVSVELSKWSGSATVFICSVRYYRTDLKRWVKDSETNIEIHRVGYHNITQWVYKHQEVYNITQQINFLISQGDHEKAKDIINNKLTELDEEESLECGQNLKLSGMLVQRLESIDSKQSP